MLWVEIRAGQGGDDAKLLVSELGGLYAARSRRRGL